jgi:hypothetical protein
VSPRESDDVEIAVAELDGFYANYHSQRYVDGALVLRMQRAPDSAQLADLIANFADIVSRGEIEVVPPSKAEIADEDAIDLDRIRLRFDRHGSARLRQLIDTLNTW